MLDQLHLPHTNNKDYVIVYRADYDIVDAMPMREWLSGMEGEMVEMDGGPEFTVDQAKRGERQAWGSKYVSTNYQYITVEGVRWRVLLDSVGWPFIIDKRA